MGNFVWNDLNDDGIQDSFEPGIADVEVKLTITYPDGTVVSVVTTTDSTGHYSFGNLLLDEDYNGDASSGPQPVYVITVATPAGFDHPSPIGTGDGMNDSNDPAGTTAEPTQGQTDTSAKANPSSESNPIAGYDFGFNDGTVLAVSLSYVNSERADDGTVSFIWETATETGNAGFNLYAQSNDVLSLVNAEMIPSSVIDSVTPVSYSYRATMDAEQFYIELISISGKSELHGPFTLGVAYGSPSDAPSGPDTGEMQKSLFLPTIRNE